MSWLSSSNDGKYDTIPLVLDLKTWRMRCSSFIVCHTYREANQLADCIAWVAMSVDFQIENVAHLDSHAIQILNADAYEITYQRVR